jgi:4-coumarate--CoA ligase (photoactive yellow protein activation family)
MHGYQHSGRIWWEQSGVLHRLLSDLISTELAALRRRPLTRALPWAPNLHLAHDLDADSLELLTLATSISQMLHIHRSGIDDYLLARLELDDWASVALTSLQQFSDELTFRTSGSSGQPKSCTHQLAWLWQEADALHAVLGDHRRVLSAVPCHHIYGFLFTVLLPQTMGLDAGQVIDMRASGPAALANALQPGDMVVAHPDYWRALLQLGITFPQDIIGTSSGAPCPDDIARGLREAGLSRLVQMFGSSETAGIGWREHEAAPYVCLPYLHADSAGLLRKLPDGTTVTLSLPDHLDWEDDQHFRPRGRRDHVVQVGGVNVSPARAAQVLEAHPAVLQASVRLMRHDEGNRLKAFVVPRSATQNSQALANELASWVRDRLAPPERPATFAFGDQLPRQGNGKPADWII